MNPSQQESRQATTSPERPVKRRRRRRRRRLNHGRKAKQRDEFLVGKPGQIPILKDTDFRIKIPSSSNTSTTTRTTTRTTPVAAAKRPFPKHSLPILLRQRESGIWSKTRHSMAQWQKRMTITPSPSVSSSCRRGGASGGNGQASAETRDGPNKSPSSTCPLWRRYAHRKFSFRELQTPATDAVLGFDRSGSYLVALGGAAAAREEESSLSSPMDDDDEHTNNNIPALVLRFYGIPSKAAVSAAGTRRRHSVSITAKKTKRPSVCPLIMAVPLEFQNGFDNDEGHPYFHHLPATVPTAVLVSSDNTLGVASVRSSEMSSSYTALTVFSLPQQATHGRSSRPEQRTLQSLILGYNDTVGGDTCMLWPTHFIPCATKSTSSSSSSGLLLWDTEYRVPGHVLILDCLPDHYRFVWIVSSSWGSSCHDETRARFLGNDSYQENTNNGLARRVDKNNNSPEEEEGPMVLTAVDDIYAEWETKTFDSETGFLLEGGGGVIQNDKSSGGGVEIAFDVCFCVNIVARQVVDRFPGKADHRVQEGVVAPMVEFVGPRDGCRAFEILLWWRGGGVGVFVLVDIMSNKYKVLKWVQGCPFIAGGRDVFGWSQVVSMRRASYRVFGADGESRPSSIDDDDDEAWYFLQRPEKNTADDDPPPIWNIDPRQKLAHPISDQEKRETTKIDNAAVLAEMPVSGMHHETVPISVHYM